MFPKTYLMMSQRPLEKTTMLLEIQSIMTILAL